MQMSHSVCCVSLIFVSLVSFNSRAQEAPAAAAGESFQRSPGGGDRTLSPGALEVARLLQVLPLIETLESLAGKERSVSGGGMSVEMLTLREQITEAVLSSFLEVDGVIAEIDNEIAQTREIRAVLE